MLYRLTGVVEHSGGMGGGHYVAYVCSRAQPPLSDSTALAHALRFVDLQTTGTYNRAEVSREMLADILGKEEQRKEKSKESGEPPSPDFTGGGKWYYVSDSHASPVDVNAVLRAQAYLLFYERVM